MTYFHFSFDQWRQAVEKVVGDDPGFVYRVYPAPEGHELESCRYADDMGNPSCIIGHAAMVLDPSFFSALSVAEAVNGEPSFGAAEIDSHVNVVIDKRTLMFLYELQNSQDCGLTWTASLDCADRLDRETIEAQAWEENETEHQD